jgi:hypothetical protein
VSLHGYKVRIVYAHISNKRESGAAMAQKVQTLFIDDLDGTEADGRLTAPSASGWTAPTTRST